MNAYNEDFYNQIHDGALSSARAIVPEVMSIFKPKSVVDFGCGTGAWLSIFKENGVEEILGVDGSPEGHSLIPEEDFVLRDLSSEFSLDKKYDLAMSLEVAEHIPHEFADQFVTNICNSSDNILWSAAVPGQNGVGHINEQWPSYWVPKFHQKGYICSPIFRFNFWNDENIENWYRQNILIFTKNPVLFKDIKVNHQILDVIHYNNWGR
jgi:SAM-dependent methyltransferase